MDTRRIATLAGSLFVAATFAIRRQRSLCVARGRLSQWTTGPPAPKRYSVVAGDRVGDGIAVLSLVSSQDRQLL